MIDFQKKVITSKIMVNSCNLTKIVKYFLLQSITKYVLNLKYSAKL